MINVNDIVTRTEDWYSLGRTLIPEFGTKDFHRFVGNAVAFYYEVVKDSRRRLNKVVIKISDKIPTAAFNLEDGSISVSSSIFNKDFYKNFFGEDFTNFKEIALVFMNGYVVHESLHAKYTKVPSMEAAIQTMSGWEKQVRKFGWKNTFTAFNIIEDIYIEAMLDNENLDFWLDSTRQILFDESKFEHYETLDSIEDAFGLCAMFKNVHTRDNEAYNVFPKGTLKVLNSVVKGKEALYSVRARVSKAFQLLDTFADFAPEEETDVESSLKEMKKADQQAENGELMSELIKGLLEAIESSEALDSEEFAELAKEVETLSEELAQKLNPQKEYKKAGSYDPVRYIEPITLDVMRDADKIQFGMYKNEPNEDIDYSFMKELAAIRTLNRSVGRARKQGSVMVKSRLHRIATDGKIFAKNDSQKRQNRRLEVLINIDMSGSTSGSVIEKELGSAKAISKALREAGIAHSIFGHSAYYQGSISAYVPTLIHIFSYDMKENNTDFDARFEQACKVVLSENVDGPIIEEVVKNFTEKESTKYLIQLSDGSPACPGYSGWLANEHTKEVINKQRARNINVFSISVVSGVVKSNDKIYGQEWNIDASVNLGGQFRNLIKRIAQ